MRGAEELRRALGAHVPGMAGNRRHYAVLCPFVEQPDGLHLLFEVRSAALRRQPGEVCFPGGRMEPGETPEKCALRETWEELHIPPRTVEVWGKTDFVADSTGSWIQPVAGRVTREGLAQLRPGEDEVAETFCVPLDFFRTHPPQVYYYTLRPEPQADFPYAQIGFPDGYDFRGGRMPVPVWRYEERAIWGLTARILQNLLTILE